MAIPSNHLQRGKKGRGREKRQEDGEEDSKGKIKKIREGETVKNSPFFGAKYLCRLVKLKWIMDVYDIHIIFYVDN